MLLGSHAYECKKDNMTYGAAILAFSMAALLACRGLAEARFGRAAFGLYRTAIVVMACLLGLMIALNPDYLQPSAHLLSPRLLSPHLLSPHLLSQ